MKKKLKDVKAQFITADGIVSNLEKIPYPFGEIYYRPVIKSISLSFEDKLDIYSPKTDKRTYRLKEICYNKKNIPQKVIYEEIV